MRIERQFTRAGQDAYNGIEFKTTTSEIRNPDGKRVFHLPDIEVPSEWSQVACDIIAQKYFRKAGVPRKLKPVAEVDVPPWLWRRTADDAALAELMPERRVGSETSAKQVFDRLAGTWTYWGWKGGYFDQEAGRPRLLRRDAPHAGEADGRTQLAAMVQHRRCTGPTASTGPPRGTTTSITAAASWWRPRAPTSIRSRTPASSSPSPTTSSTRAASWTSGCARRASSSTAPAPARTSRVCAARTSRSPAAASRRA